ncbi:MAG: hypothetical protein EOO51_13290 [Flavobacterium sp.]|nr:MAG: hypothetical protein EOO51_13290 [Flavobacterium sp.]
MYKITFTLLLLLAFACERSMTFREFEQDVFDQVFIDVVDATYRDKRLTELFPEDDRRISKEDFNSIEKQIKISRYRVIRDSLRNDTLDLVIAVSNKGNINEKSDLRRYDTRKFRFKKYSELPVESNLDNWSDKYPKFMGVMSFSDIRFNKEKSVGELDVSYSCGGKCGFGFTVSVYKSHGSWRVKKVVQTWIA